MSDEASCGNEGQQLAVGDQRRSAVGKAAFSALWTAIAFFVFTVPAKQVKPVYEHAPWLNDPYDALYSFAMFLVPLAAAFFLVQVSLCRKAEVLPAGRARSVLRGSRVAVIVMTATLASCWISVAAGANRARRLPSWRVSPSSLVLISGLSSGWCAHPVSDAPTRRAVRRRVTGSAT
jgi:hypothetical protein